MQRITTRWTTAAAAAAFLALPVAGAAQSTTPPQQPPAATQPTPPTPRPQQTTTTQPASGAQVDANAAKKHLSEARDTLSQLTSMPEAAKLQGDARTQVSELIANFNELITTQSDWRAAYGKVDANLTSLLGPEGSEPAQPPVSGTAGAVGTSGSAAGALDPAIRTKLAEFRTNLKMFEQAAGGRAESGAMPPSAATGATSNPANPTVTGTPTNPDPAKPGQPPTTAGATGTSGMADQQKAAEQAGHSEADKHLDAISAILEKSKTGTLTKAQTDELKKHVAELRALLSQRR